MRRHPVFLVRLDTGRVGFTALGGYDLEVGRRSVPAGALGRSGSFLLRVVVLHQGVVRKVSEPTEGGQDDDVHEQPVETKRINEPFQSILHRGQSIRNSYSRLQVEPASLGFHDADGRVESDEPVRIFLHVVQVGPDGQTDITRPEPTYRTTGQTMSAKQYWQVTRRTHSE